MASIKVKLRRPSAEGRKCGIYYQVIHRRRVRQMATPYRVLATEWCDGHVDAGSAASAGRVCELMEVVGLIEADLRRFDAVLAEFEALGRPYTVEDIVGTFRGCVYGRPSLFAYMRQEVERHRDAGRQRTSEAYASAMRSFGRFRGGADMMLDSIDSPTMQAYEAYLLATGVVKNTVSFYMRILRAVYSRAVEEGLVEQRHPFRRVYTGIDRTAKRAIPLSAIRRLSQLDLTGSPVHAYARDMFMFSFYTRGMSFVDLAFLRKSDLDRGVLCYRRRKTGQLLAIKWERHMQEIVDRYSRESSGYLLPVIDPSRGNERRQYMSALFLVNRKLKDLGREMALGMPLTMYVARHSWASIAREQRVPLSVISEGMGHESETTTRIYLASLDTSVVDNANAMILGLL